MVSAPFRSELQCATNTKLQPHHENDPHTRRTGSMYPNYISTSAQGYMYMLMYFFTAGVRHHPITTQDFVC